MKVQRYSDNSYIDYVTRDDTGKYVLYADYAALEAENERLNDLAHCGIDADGHPLEWRIMADHHRIGEEQLRIEVAKIKERCAGLERERDAKEQDDA